jgi:hypothetical protein
MWYDAADPSTITLETGVLEWADKSGNGHDVEQTTSASQPALVKDQLNGYPVVRFDGVNDYLNDASINIGTQEYAFNIIFKPLSVSSNNQNVVSTEAFARWRLRAGDDLQWDGNLVLSNVGAANTNFGQSNVTTFEDWGFTASLTNGIDTYFNGDIAVSRSTYTGFDQIFELVLGAGSGGARALNCEIAEILFYPATYREPVEGYLHWKYNMVDRLSVSHPYKTIRPMSGSIESSWWSDCVFLSHFDGVDGATTATDISTEGAGSPHIITFNGDAQIDTDTTDAFGGNSGVLLLDGSGDYVNTDSHVDLNLGGSATPFTLECWFKSTTSATQVLFNRGGGVNDWNTTNGNNYLLQYQTEGKFYFYFNKGGAAEPVAVDAGTALNGSLHHVVVTYDGTTTRVFFDGILGGSSTASYTIPSSLSYFNIGRNGGSGGDYANGSFDEVRIINGEAITPPIPPPTSPYSRFI